MLPAAEAKVDEARVIKGLLVFAGLVAPLALLADDNAKLSGPLSGVRQFVNDAFSVVGLVPTALALALVATVLITRAPRGGVAAKLPETTELPPDPSSNAEAEPESNEPSFQVQAEARSEYERAVNALTQSVTAWSPPAGVDPSSDFAEILNRKPPQSPWGD